MTKTKIKLKMKNINKNVIQKYINSTKMPLIYS